MDIQKIIREELANVVLESITKNFTRAIETYKKIQLKQQDLRNAFVSEKDPKKKDKLKSALIKMHKEVVAAEKDFNKALSTEPVQDDYEDLAEISVANTLDSMLNEDAIKAFNDELNGENIKAKMYTAHGTGLTVQAQFTNKKWDDGVPVTKYLTRGGKKTIKTPRGKFRIIETDKFWYYEINNGWAAVNKKDYGTPPFEF